MAKRGTLEHPKVRRLGRAIGMPAWAALGLLEAFWHWVGRYTPSGLLSKEDVVDCADTIRYDGDLAKTLYSCGLLDAVEGGWYVHDWHDHADDTVKKALHKRGEKFANGSPVRSSAPSEPLANDSRIDSEPISNGSRTIRDSLAKPEPSQSQSQSQSHSPQTPRGSSLPALLPPELRSEDLVDAWSEYLGYRMHRSLGPPGEQMVTDLAAAVVRHKLPPERTAMFVRHAVAKNWKAAKAEYLERWVDQNPPPDSVRKVDLSTMEVNP